VIGPSLDGGYYLIGFKNETFSPRVFDGIHWSTESVFEKTHLKSARPGGLAVHTLKPLRDIDTVNDLRIKDLRKKGRYDYRDLFLLTRRQDHSTRAALKIMAIIGLKPGKWPVAK